LTTIPDRGFSATREQSSRVCYSRDKKYISRLSARWGIKQHSEPPIAFKKGKIMNQQVQQSEHATKMQQLLAKCWTDEAFKKQMLTNPMAAMKAEGVEPPAGLTIKVVENTDDTLYLTIPVKPSGLSDEDLENVAGGGYTGQLIGGIVGGVIGGVVGAPAAGVGGALGAAAGAGAGATIGDAAEDTFKYIYARGW
jgi:hypothetical protein